MTAIAALSGSLLLTAPVEGTVSFHPPRCLCGELEVFDAGERVASVSGNPIDTPARAFVLRQLVEDGARVTADEPIVELRFA